MVSSSPKYPEVDFVQLQINYLDYESKDIESRKCYEVAKKHHKPVIVMEPIKGGALANVSDSVRKLFNDYDKEMSIASFAIRFAASLDNVLYVLSGMSDIEQVKDNISYMDDFKKLNEEEMKLCLKAAEIINSERAIKCTACGYCVKGCPKKIEIPKFFETYNRRKQATSAGTLMRNKEAYKKLLGQSGKPAECIKCGKCEASCPQHLSIRKYLEDIVKEYEN